MTCKTTFNLTRTLTISPTLSTSQYSGGDVLGGVLMLDANGFGEGGIIRRIILVDDDNEKASLKLHLFNSAPTTFADSEAYLPTVDDLNKQIGVISIGATDYTTYNGNAIAFIEEVNLDYTIDDYLYLYVVCDAVPTYTASTDLTFRFVIWAD